MSSNPKVQEIQNLFPNLNEKYIEVSRARANERSLEKFQTHLIVESKCFKSLLEHLQCNRGVQLFVCEFTDDFLSDDRRFFVTYFAHLFEECAFSFRRFYSLTIIFNVS